MNAVAAQQKSPINWRVFSILFVAGLVGIAALANMMTFILPTLAPDQPPPPTLVLWGAMLVQYGGLLALSVWGGMMLAVRMNTQPAPFVSTWLDNSPVPETRILWVSAIVGTIGGFAMLMLHRVVFQPMTGAPLNLAAEAPLPVGLSVAFLYGGITEELLMRLGLMTLLLWLLARRWHTDNNQPTTAAFWVANGIITILFALAHLPSAALSVPITPLLVVSGLVLNSVALIFGWLYWRRGIEAAIVCHMCFHIGYTLVGAW